MEKPATSSSLLDNSLTFGPKSSTMDKEKILREIDKFVTNAYELPKNNPKKQYYEGWDDAVEAIYRMVEEMD